MASRKSRVRRRRQRRMAINAILLALLLISSLFLYLIVQETRNELVISLWPFKQVQVTTIEPSFADGTHVLLTDDAQKTVANDTFQSLKNQVGQVVSSQIVGVAGQSQVIYDVQYHEQLLSGLLESDLQSVTPPYRLGQTVSLIDNEQEDGEITHITVDESSGQRSYRYSVRLPQAGERTKLSESDFVWVKQLELQETNTAAENNAVLQEAMVEAKHHSKSRLLFPSGRFLIGSQNPEKEYLILSSNTALIGQETTLVVDGSARWFGLATGPNETDGLSNFRMENLTVEAKDLTTGNQFIIMANHGQNWHIENNRFVLVHKLSSHIFDLGGVQNATFYNNSFEGYAPELTTVTELGQRSTHNFIAEAIQLDASSDNGEWDGGFLKAIDPDYLAHNPKKLLSNNITIADNQFIPYWDENGQVVAYGGGIGQHSSSVGYVAVYGNVFTDTLSLRFQHLVSEGDRWVFEPIHLPATVDNTVYGNVIN